MRIFDQSKIVELKTVDLSLGYLIPDKIVVAHHEAVPSVLEKSHYVVDKTFKNGGISYRKIVDKPAKPAEEAFDEYEEIQVYVPYSKEELKDIRASEIRKRLDQLSQDFIQAWAGAQIYDLEDRKTEFAALHNELRSILGKEPRLYY